MVEAGAVDAPQPQLSRDGLWRPAAALGPVEDWEKDLVAMLRKEAYDVKDCFTRYSVQGIAIVTALLTFVARYQSEAETVGYSSVASLLLLASLSRMATHKYAAASRLNAYELHLQRTRLLGNESEYEWSPEMRKVGWEEAMRAWRIVTATVYDHLYTTPPPRSVAESPVPASPDVAELSLWERWRARVRRAREWFDVRLRHEWGRLIWRLRADKLRDKRLARPDARKWFEPESLMKEGASYYPGGYLATMLAVLHGYTLICLVPLAFIPFQVTGREQWIAWAVFSTSAFIMLINFRQVHARQQVIQGGLLSIHSAAILWQATIIAHFRALAQIRRDNRIATYDGYTETLSLHAISLKNNIDQIHHWMSRGFSEARHPLPGGDRPPDQRT